MIEQNYKFMVFKIRGHCFSFIIHAENYHFVGTGIRGSAPLRKKNLTKFKPSTVIVAYRGEITSCTISFNS